MSLTDEDLLEYSEDEASNLRWAACALCAFFFCLRAARSLCLVNSIFLHHKCFAHRPLSARPHLLGLALHALRALIRLAAARPLRPFFFSRCAPGASPDPTGLFAPL